jgi:cytochrome c biogenesis protein ResB
VKGEKVKTQDVNLAHPLRYGGISIHQEFLRNKIQYAKLKVISKNGESQFCEVKAGDRFKLGNTNITVLANRFKSDAVQLINPYSGTDILVSGNPVGFNDALRDWSFCIEGIFYKEATCLRAVKDPGMNLIWAGTFFMLCGFCIMFLIPHQQIWISLQQSNEWYIIVAGSSTKNLDSFEEIFNKIVLSVKQSLYEDGYAQQRYEKK